MKGKKMLNFWRSAALSWAYVAFVFSAVTIADVQATTFYVDSFNGSDANDGRSPGRAWRSLNTVSSRSFATGDDLLLRSGSVFENQTLHVSWSGTSSDWVDIGCYKTDSGGNASICQKTDPKPEINGTFEVACAQSTKCPMDQSGAVPASMWGALVTVDASYVTVRNLKVRDSSGYPIVFYSTRSTLRHHFVLENSIITHNAMAIVLVQYFQYGVIRGLEATLFGMCEIYRYAPCSGAGWPGGIQIADSARAMILVENNLVHSGFAEAFNCLRSTHVVFRGNRAGNVHSDGYYLDQCSNTLVENNIGWGDLDNRWGSDRGFAGINVATEDYPSRPVNSTDNVIRNNLITGFGSCIASSQWPDAVAKGAKVGFSFYGNTCIAVQKRNVSIFESAKNLSNILIKNNIFYSPLASEGSCISPGTSSIKFESNLWDGLSRFPKCVDSYDLIDDPEIVTPVEDFARFTSINQPYARHFGLKPSSPVLARGTTFPSESVLGGAEFQSVVSTVVDDRCGISASSLQHDYYCAARQSPPSLGAIDRAKYPPKAPILVNGGG